MERRSPADQQSAGFQFFSNLSEVCRHDSGCILHFQNVAIIMTHQQPNSERMVELLKDASQNWVSLAASTAWVDLFGYWRGTDSLLDFAVRYPS